MFSKNKGENYALVIIYLAQASVGASGTLWEQRYHRPKTQSPAAALILLLLLLLLLLFSTTIEQYGALKNRTSSCSLSSVPFTGMRRQLTYRSHWQTFRAT